MNKRNIPILKSLKDFNSILNISEILPLPTDTKYGNLTLKYTDIIIITHNLNYLIIQFNELYYVNQKNLNEPKIISPFDQHQLNMILEQIFYWLHKISDNLLSLLWLLEYLKKENKNPKKLNISCIGDFIKNKNSFNNKFLKHFDTLKTINTISNIYKHSFINNEINLIQSVYDPIVFALGLHYNNIENDAKFYNENFNDLISNFDLFLKDIKEYIIINKLVDF